MKLIKYFICLALPLMLLSAKCKKINTKNFVTKAEKNTSFGGVYGSGYTKEYFISFSPKVCETLSFDSIYITSTENTVFRKSAKERGWHLSKLPDSTYYLTIFFNGGELMQNDGEIKQVEIPTCAKPTALEDKEAVIYGKYKGQSVSILVDKFTKKEDVYQP